MRIISLKIQNFQGIKEKEFRFDGRNAAIFGDNGTGKTTAYNAFTWLLTGNPSTGAKGFTPKTTGSHNLNHTAEALLEVEGKQIEIKKDFHEVWSTKRGTNDKEFKGHATDYFIDGVPTKEKDYQAKMVELFGDPERIKTLTMPFYFAETMKWDDRRKILLDICGDISDDEIIETTEGLEHLKEILDGHSVEDYKKIALARKKKIADDIKSLPARIDEAEKAIPQIFHDETKDSLQAKIHELQNQIKSTQEKRSLLQTNEGSKLQALEEITKRKTEIEKARLEYTEHKHLEQQAAEDRIRNLKNEKEDQEHRLKNYTQEKDILQKQIEDMTRRRKELTEEWKKVNERTWNEDQEICPTCGQELPADKIQELKEAFNLKRSQDLEKINEAGQKVSKTKIEEWEKQVEEHQAKIDELKKEIELTEKEIKETPDPEKPKPFEDTNFYKELKKDLDELTEKETKSGTSKTDEIDAEIKELEEKKAAADRNLQEYELAEKQQKRIQELEEEQKELAKTFEKTESEIATLELFTKAKVEKLDDKINSRFEAVRFRLFQEQINGGIKDDCEVLIPCGDKLVPYTFANNAARINAGMEIIHTLSEAWETNIPVWIDNAESVTKLKEFENLQTIRLVVSENDNDLRLEQEN